MSSEAKKWGVVAGMAVLAAAVLFAGGIVGGVLTGVIPVQAEEDGEHGHFRGRGGYGRGLDAAAEVLGMEPEDLIAELRGGKTLAEIAEERGVDPLALEDVMMQQRQQMLQRAEEDGSRGPECAECEGERSDECEGNRLERKGGSFGMRRGGRGPVDGFRSGGPAPEGA